MRVILKRDRLLLFRLVQNGGNKATISNTQKPCISSFLNFADIVVANATVNHCDDMGRILREAARLVRPGGLLFTDQDPQRSAWNFKGFGLFLRDIRYSFMCIARRNY
ncbi:type 11 methyltransferase [Tolypothrix sp. NIES-4075]|uniref:methyltransferase domain-containing protein n=1 Tax=Tolypothrix sp. NIES-4075 TaxID=2005459 RepID=UPI000B5CE964|nr:methyltransferase domain-containing protein [Tolypothrix sp. NIES-4075]GAX44085.1 type 11 methyltransferase [Tolypothrix sp. NIES-4075]